MNETLCYYNENAKEYFDKTVNVQMSDKYDKFLNYLSKGKHILDLGCGSGRDSFYFIQNGYIVTAMDGSKELCDLASEHIGQLVDNIDFIHLSGVDCYDGIWACASLLHLDKVNFSQVLGKMYVSLKVDGFIYISLKVDNDYSGYEGGRFFTYYSENTLNKLLYEANFNIIDTWKTGDGLNRNVEWINVILSKK